MSDVVKYLQIGDVLQIQFAPPNESQDRYATTLVGFLPGKSLIITTPRKQGNPIIVREGQTFTLRMLQGSNIFGFMTSVLKVSSKPYPYLHLAYPVQVESAVVRNAPRVSTEIQAIATIKPGPSGEEDQRPVIISDISSTGARVMDRDCLGEVGTVVQVTYSVPVCGGQDILRVKGVIRNIRQVTKENSPSAFIHGIEFRGLTRFQELLLCAYVLSSIARE